MAWVKPVADYAIGDVQGCYEALLHLLECIQFDDKKDRLWFVGDLVNRGPQSLEVLRFVKALALKPYVCLGNHDLFLLVKLFTKERWHQEHTLQTILKAPDREELGHWLRNQHILHHDPALRVVISHAGIAPIWDLTAAKAHALELEQALAGDDFVSFLSNMYGNTPNCWSENLSGMARLRLITNYFTRMRFCDAKGCLSFEDQPSAALFPWFSVPNRPEISADIVFGHWAALQGVCDAPNIHALDTGYFWGGELTALRLQDKCRFSVAQ